MSTWLNSHPIFHEPTESSHSLPLSFPMSPTIFPENWSGKCSSSLHNGLSVIVFLFLDFLDALLCLVFKFIDEFVEGITSNCYCRNESFNGDDEMVSETLFERRNVFREMGFGRFSRKLELSEKMGLFSAKMKNRWSDCGCDFCVFWTDSGDDIDKKLHVVVTEPSLQVCGGDGDCKPIENVIFIHGFMSSSSFWTETVFKHLPEHVRSNYRLIAVDLLGFGKSPKPQNCLYTLNDHVEMIEKSVIARLKSSSFHVVAHSMGCNVALALAAKHSEIVRTVTLVAPPYYSSSGHKSSLVALNGLAGKKLWPPLAFGSAVMSWYEHIGRCVCFLVCRYHRTWERILKFITRKREFPFMITDMTKHTHHSAWHSMHNVICGGAKFSDGYLKILINSGVKIQVVQGDRDAVVPSECYRMIRTKFPAVETDIVTGADHGNVIIGNEELFIRKLERLWDGDGDMMERRLIR